MTHGFDQLLMRDWYRVRMDSFTENVLPAAHKAHVKAGLCMCPEFL